MTEDFDWQQKMSREEAIAILAKEPYARGHLEPEDGHPEQGWEQLALFDVKADKPVDLDNK